MSKDRFITQVFAGGTRDTVVGTSINGYAIGEWADKVDEQIASLTDNLYNLLQEQVQKVSLGFPASVPNIKDLGDIKIDSITKDISHDVVIDPNPPKLYEEVAPPDMIYELTHQWKPYTYMEAHNVSKSYKDIFFIDDIAKHLTSYAEVLRRDIKACSDSSVAKQGMIDELAEINGLLQKLRGVQDRGI